MKILFLFLLLCAPLNAIKPTRVILGCDTHPFYIEFWPIVARAWKQIVGVRPTLALIAHPGVRVDESLGDVIRFNPIPGIPTATYAQVVRLLLPALFPDDVCILSDMDMIPVSKVYFTSLIQHIPQDSFVVYHNNAYGPRYRQYPICYNVAKGSVFRELFDVSAVEDIPAKVREWAAYKIGWCTDEIILHATLNTWPERHNRLKLLNYSTGDQRIDRSKWRFDRDLLKSGFYIDAHLLRPYHTYQYELNELFYELGLL